MLNLTQEFKRRHLNITYVALTIYAIHFFLFYYILSTFLNKYFNDGDISLLFLLSSIISMIVANYLGEIIKKYNNKRVLIFSSILEFILTLSLVFSNFLPDYLIGLIFTILYANVTLIFICLNIFLERFSEADKIGSTRGLSLVIYNLGAIGAPFIASQIYNLSDYPGIFLVSAISILPLIYIVKKYYAKLKEVDYETADIWQSIKIIKKNKDIRGVILSELVLNINYTILNIYLILYLTKSIGIPVTILLGILVPISIVPYILTPYLLGRYTDEYFGEKKPMIIGLIVMAIMLMIIAFFKINSPNIFLWLSILVILRIGATINETTNYSYFYKKISYSQAGLMVFFQNLANLGPLILTGLGLVLIDTLHIKLTYFFLLGGFLTLLTILPVLKITDTEPVGKRFTFLKNNLEKRPRLNPFRERLKELITSFRK